jgi:hypothetical protein
VVGDLFPPSERAKWTGLLHLPVGIAALLLVLAIPEISLDSEANDERELSRSVASVEI